MILDVICGFDAAYDEVSRSIDFSLDYTYCENLIKLKAILNPFLYNALLDCYTKGDSGVYSSLIVDKNLLDFFKTKHTKAEFITFIGNLNKYLQD